MTLAEAIARHVIALYEASAALRTICPPRLRWLIEAAKETK